MFRTRFIFLSAAALVASGACPAAQPTTLSAQEARAAHGAHAMPASDAPVRLLPGLGRLHRRIATPVARAQQLFDQGLSLAYAFNHAEAVRSFREAARLDPRCAMCQWGIAYALGPNINAPMEAAAYGEAHAAATRASALSSGMGADRALIVALGKRYAPIAPADRAGLDSAYATAMANVAARFPLDPDVSTLHAESIMQLSPWDYWTADDKPRPGTTALLASLARALGTDPDHPGACHFYIHAVEAAFPRRALACAERLAALMPGAGHIVHMPAHIYLRVGRYDDAIAANRHAVGADETFLADARQRAAFYAVAYYPHNFHFLAFAATMAGRGNDAVRAARDAALRIPPDMAESTPELQLLVAYPQLTLATFGRWAEVRREPMPPVPLRVATGLAWFARGIAAARSGEPGAAAMALDSVRTIARGETRHPVGPVLRIAERVLEAELASERGDVGAAVARLTAAVAIEDSLGYMEPPYWHQPVRTYLGAALLAAERPAEASARYREDLQRFPENVWSLGGLARSLAAEGKGREAAAVQKRYEAAMKRAAKEARKGLSAGAHEIRRPH